MMHGFNIMKQLRHIGMVIAHTWPTSDEQQQLKNARTYVERIQREEGMNGIEFTHVHVDELGREVTLQSRIILLTPCLGAF